jgi:hypothetical protein
MSNFINERNNPMHRIISSVIVSMALLLSGCDQKSNETASSTANDHGQEHAESDKGHAGHSGEVIELGTTTVEGQSVKASRDKGEIKAGGDAPIDIWIDGALGNAAAVRFWIGTENGKASVKAKAGVEDNHWHTHAEIPDPLPADSKLWVEIEAKDGKKSVVSFDLKQ